ncbi:MAG: hypothetical protein KBS81_08130 [Spirochaetales bacterium]|nr:hypothetical protein [Candidatus Physcosoma equi]
MYKREGGTIARHIVFCPKHRRKAIYGQYRFAICRIIRELLEKGYPL